MVFQLGNKKIGKPRNKFKIFSRKSYSTFLKQAVRDGFFHGDMHQGNLFVDPKGNIIPVDFGIMGS